MRCSTLRHSLAWMQEKHQQAPKQIACSTWEPGVEVRKRSLMENWEDSNRCCKYFCRAGRALSGGNDLLCCSPAKGDIQPCQNPTAVSKEDMQHAGGSFVKWNSRGVPKSLPMDPGVLAGALLPQFSQHHLLTAPSSPKFQIPARAACFPFLIS